ncbi:MAG TPA: Do family serine endopeptidase [bacterium]|mgnify:CR=1 FL=1|nr:Do family serine endopeptidase [bacterium]
MKNNGKRLALLSALVIGIIAGIVFAARFDLVQYSLAEDTKKIAASPKISSALDIQEAFVSVAETIKPSVVNIRTTKIIEMSSHPFFRFEGDQFKDFFGDDFFDKYFDKRNNNSGKRKMQQSSLGSGFVIRDDGYILTNNHVVADMDEVLVKFVGNDKEYEAKVIGTDPVTDLAVIKIDTKDSLTAVPLGDSDQARVGSWAIAIGNPFGLESTVTAGIVSAKGRVIGQGPYDDFIQTDAAINPGNSGGPLVNIHGQVIGINSAIYSQSGIMGAVGNMGIGFAIPINMARDVFEELIETGKVSRGYLGILIEDIDERLAGAFGLKNAEGVLVTNVLDDTPAEKAGMKAEDIIIQLNDTKILNVKQLQKEVAGIDKGEKATITVLRNGKKKQLKVRLEERPDDVASGTKPGGNFSEEELGLELKTLTPEIARQLDAKSDKGAVVMNVDPGSPADKAELMQGDIITKADRKPVDNAGDFIDIIDELKPGDDILIVVERRGYNRFFVLEIPEKKD